MSGKFNCIQLTTVISDVRWIILSWDLLLKSTSVFSLSGGFGLQATALRGTVDAASATTAGALAAAAAQTLKQKAAELHSQRLSGLALQMQREPSVAVNPLQAVKELGGMENGDEWVGDENSGEVDMEEVW